MTSKVILGIDLGTTNTVVAAVRAGGKAEVLSDSKGRSIHPSVVSFHPNGSVLVGQDAKDRRAIDPRNTLFSIKRLIGRSIHARETREMTERMPFRLDEGSNQQPVLQTRAGEFAAPEVSALVLDHVKKIAEKALGHAVSDAVITVPASFTDAQRSATTAAGSIAGLNVIRIINEPTAAAVAFGYQKNLHETLAVYDFGGGTFDISILKVRGDRFEVLSSAGDSFLGGDDIDERIVLRMVEAFLKRHKVDLRGDAMALQRLQGVAEQVKIDLGQRTRSLVKVEEIAYGDGGSALDLEMALTRAELEEMAGALVRQTFPVCDEALHQAGLSAKEVTGLVLVGGTTKMPLVREMASKYFQREPRTDVNPDEAVAIGAALQGEALRALTRKEHPGRITRPGMGAVPAPEKVTAVRAQVSEDTQEETLTDVDDLFEGDEETTALRSASELPADPGLNLLTETSTIAQIKTIKRPVPGGIVEKGGGLGQKSAPPPVPRKPPVPAAAAVASAAGPVILEVTPQALGIATIAGYCEHVIKRNASIPCQAVRHFATSRDDQRTVRIRVCQGNDRQMVANTPLGDLVLDKLAPGPRGKTKIEVTFSLDVSGRLQVKARDPDSGIEQEASMEVIGAQSGQELSAAGERLRAMRK